MASVGTITVPVKYVKDEDIDVHLTIEDHLRWIIAKLGLNPADQHFSRTPERVAKVLRDYVQDLDLNVLLSDGFEDDDPSDQTEKVLVVQTRIPFMGICAHHLLPFFGSAAVGYLPRDRVVGLSKLTRLVYAAGHLAPTTQEHITNLVADTLYKSEAIRPKGVAVLASALHGCMAVRGVESPSTRTLTSAVRGEFLEVPALEAKFMDLAKGGLM
jgi:GTP cyclohydrolase I